MTDQLSDLEIAAATLCAGQIGVQGGKRLVQQLATAQVTLREFTGYGFYTEFDVDQGLAAEGVTASPGGWVRSFVGPAAYPLEFMLYVRDGYANMIEAYSHGNGYGDLDLLTTSFTPPQSRAPDPDFSGD